MKTFLRAWSITNLYSNVWRLIESEFDNLDSLFYFFIKKSIVIPRERSNMGCYLFCWERFNSISCSWDNLCIVTHLDLLLYNVLSTYALVMLSHQWIPKQYMFYLNGLNLYLPMLTLNCWGRFLLSVFFWKRDILKFLGMLFIGSLIRAFLWKCHPLLYYV